MIYFRPQNHKNIKAGIGYNFQRQFAASFLIWESDSLAFRPRGGTDSTDPASTLVLTRGLRANVDPYIKIYTKKGHSHDIKGRVYFVDNDVVTSPDQANASTTYTLDYQYQMKVDSNGTFVAGAFMMYADARAQLFGNHNVFNPAAYAQMDYKFFKKLFVTAGVRAEYFEIDGSRQGDADYNLFGATMPFYPIFRAAASYQALKGTFLRTSWGQGVRFPSIAERFTQTSVGALNIFPNANLTRETGWAAEIGVKQVVLFDKWKALIDVAGFWNEYNDMIEFTFGTYNPPGTNLSLNPNDPMYILNWVGFQAINAERARITGIEATITGEGQIGPFEIRTIAGYTYTNPISLNNDSIYRSTFSDNTTNMLKYRFNHMVKGDVELIYKDFNFGISCRYTSFMKNIDRAFQEVLPGGEQIFKGLEEYRALNNRGFAIVDARVGYKVNEQVQMSFIANNLFNIEYTSRPGAIQPPRMFMMQAMIRLK
jgi:iron complex outermembrane receptor protein